MKLILLVSSMLVAAAAPPRLAFMLRSPAFRARATPLRASGGLSISELATLEPVLRVRQVSSVSAPFQEAPPASADSDGGGDAAEEALPMEELEGSMPGNAFEAGASTGTGRTTMMAREEQKASVELSRQIWSHAPQIAAAGGVYWAGKKAYLSWVRSSAAAADDYSRAMVQSYFDEKMQKKVHVEFKFKPVGPSGRRQMFDKTVDRYIERVKTSSKTVSSFAHFTSLWAHGDQKTGAELARIGLQMLDSRRVFDAERLLFYGERVLPSDEGKAGLEPLRAGLMARHKSNAVAYVELASLSIAMEAYKAQVVAAKRGGRFAPKAPTSEDARRLGLDADDEELLMEELEQQGYSVDYNAWKGKAKEAAKNMGAERRGEGNLTEVSAMVEADEAGASAAAAEFAAKEAMLGTTVTCDGCGYTMFIAEDREDKFFDEDYVCPECDAPRSKFTVSEGGGADSESDDDEGEEGEDEDEEA